MALLDELMGRPLGGGAGAAVAEPHSPGDDLMQLIQARRGDMPPDIAALFNHRLHMQHHHPFGGPPPRVAPAQVSQVESLLAAPPNYESIRPAAAAAGRGGGPGNPVEPIYIQSGGRGGGHPHRQAPVLPDRWVRDVPFSQLLNRASDLPSAISTRLENAYQEEQLERQMAEVFFCLFSFLSLLSCTPPACTEC